MFKEHLITLKEIVGEQLFFEMRGNRTDYKKTKAWKLGLEIDALSILLDKGARKNIKLY